MSESHSDALVFFGATGDLAYKKIFPALQARRRFPRWIPRTLPAASSVATGTRRVWHRIPRSRPSPRCGWKSIRGAGKGSRSTSGLGS